MPKVVMQSLNDAQSGFPLLNALPDTHAWLKDTNGYFVAANQLFLNRFHLKNIDDILGKTDIDLAPAHMVDGYIKDDQRVLSGETITDRLELLNERGKATSWFLTSKWPVYDYNDNIIGTFGITRHTEVTDIEDAPFRDLNAPVEYIRAHYMEAITVTELAQVTCLSVSALERRFKKHTGKTPRQYITEVRLDQARLLILETNNSLGEIAQKTGFSDQSHFTRSYLKRFNINPSEERKRYR